MLLHADWLTAAPHGQRRPISIERILQDGGSFRHPSGLPSPRREIGGVLAVDGVVEADGVSVPLGAILGAGEGAPARLRPAVGGEGGSRRRFTSEGRGSHVSEIFRFFSVETI